MIVVFGICIGFALGFSASLYLQEKRTGGNLVIVDDPEEEAYIFLEIAKTDIQELRMRPTIKLNVIDKGQISQK